MCGSHYVHCSAPSHSKINIFLLEVFEFLEEGSQHVHINFNLCCTVMHDLFVLYCNAGPVASFVYIFCFVFFSESLPHRAVSAMAKVSVSVVFVSVWAATLVDCVTGVNGLYLGWVILNIPVCFTKIRSFSAFLLAPCLGWMPACCLQCGVTLPPKVISGRN